MLLVRLCDLADDSAPVGWIRDLPVRSAAVTAGHQGCGLPWLGDRRVHGLGQRGQGCRVTEVEAQGIEPVRQVDVPGQGDAGRRGTRRLQSVERVGGDRLDGRSGIRKPVDEGAVGAVLQQTADQVGEQVPMRAHRIVGAAGNPALALGEHPVVEGLAHAVQALQLERRAVRQLQDRRHRMGVVRGELRVEARPQPQQGLGAGEIGQVGVGLAGVDRIAGQALLSGPI